MKKLFKIRKDNREELIFAAESLYQIYLLYKEEIEWDGSPKSLTPGWDVQEVMTQEFPGWFWNSDENKQTLMTFSTFEKMWEEIDGIHIETETDDEVLFIGGGIAK